MSASARAAAGRRRTALRAASTAAHGRRPGLSDPMHVGNGCSRLALISKGVLRDLRPEDPSVEQPAVRVLVVDDSVDLADSIALLLSTSGTCTARAVYDTESALAEAARFAPHVVVLDISFDNYRYEGPAAGARLLVSDAMHLLSARQNVPSIRPSAFTSTGLVKWW